MAYVDTSSAPHLAPPQGANSPSVGAVERPAKRANAGPRVFWTASEWVNVARALIRLFPELGLPDEGRLASVKLRHLIEAMQVLPSNRHRHIGTMTSARPHLAVACRAIVAESTKTGPLPPCVVYRQPDGPNDGPALPRITWSDREWHKIAVELAYQYPAYLETLHGLKAQEIYKAQRVLPTSRRRKHHSLFAPTVRKSLGVAFRGLRAEIEAARRSNQQNADATQSQAEEGMRKAAENVLEASRRVILADALQSPAFVVEALKTAGIGSLVDAVAARLAGAAQGIIENALLAALSSERVRAALVVNLHLDRDGAPATAPAISAPTAPGPKVQVITKPKIAIVGALNQQGEIIATAFPQLRIKPIDKNLHGQALKEAISNCDKVIGMTNFIDHSTDGVCYKTAGERYTRVDGGLSAVRRQIEVWIATGILKVGAQ